MPAKSNTPVEIEEWIVKTINSCTTIRQIQNSRKLIDLYNIKLSNETDLSWEVKHHLRKKLVEHYKNTKLELLKNQEL
jgi:hypothetical protein